MLTNLFYTLWCEEVLYYVNYVQIIEFLEAQDYVLFILYANY